MLSFSVLIKHSIYQQKKQQGFVVLTSVVLLCIAGILFTTNMVSSQLINNQIIGNYYRNNEAFVNAESGIHFALSQLVSPTTENPLPTNFPINYVSVANHYDVKVEASSNGLQITSNGTSVDGSAKRVMSIEVEPYFNFPIPEAAISSDGMLNLDDNVSVINGCDAPDCQVIGNVAENSLLTSPENDSGVDIGCSMWRGKKDIVADGVLEGNKAVKIVAKVTDSEGGEGYDWGEATYPEDTKVFGIEANTEGPNSLFENTFGMTMTENLKSLSDSAVSVDVDAGESCINKLTEFAANDTEAFIFIKGKCILGSPTEVTIGSPEHPKLVIIEGGVFTSDIKIVGMVYFIPGSVRGSLDDSDITLKHITVQGALLSEYKCAQNSGKPLSVEFDKLVLDELYRSLDIKMLASGYRLVAGTWKDF